MCKNAFQLLFNIGTSTLQSVGKSIKDGNLVPSLHGMYGKVGNNTIPDEVLKSIIKYLEDKKADAEPHASNVVRTTTKMALREDDNNIELPSNYTKRGMYINWCYDRGYKAELRTATSSYGKLKDYARRNDD